MTAVPRLLVLTDRHRCAAVGRDLLGTVTEALDAGAPAIVLREKDLDNDERRRLGAELAAVAAAVGARFVVASDADLAQHLGADGVHLAAGDPLPTAAPGTLLGRSCHDHHEVAAASADHLDYLTVSPFAVTESKPGYGPPLGVEGVARLAMSSDVPVLALGGVRPDHVEPLLEAGAHGVAVMGAVMAAPDPAEVVAEVLRRLPGGSP